MREDHPSVSQRIPIVGLTGGIASGKSTVAELLAAMGIDIIDTDHLAHLITGPGGAAIPAIIENFGEEFLEEHGALDRSRMRADVFKSPEHRKQLEEIMHPLIREAVEHQISHAHSSYAVVVVPLLYESAFFKERVNRILVVDCDENTQIQRALQRTGMTQEILQGIMKAQASRAQRLSIADDVIQNDGNLEGLKEQVEALNHQYRQLFAN
jgi:dephospho-CoA kinase